MFGLTRKFQRHARRAYNRASKEFQRADINIDTDRTFDEILKDNEKHENINVRFVALMRIWLAQIRSINSAYRVLLIDEPNYDQRDITIFYRLVDSLYGVIMRIVPYIISMLNDGLNRDLLIGMYLVELYKNNYGYEQINKNIKCQGETPTKYIGRLMNSLYLKAFIGTIDFNV